MVRSIESILDSALAIPDSRVRPQQQTSVRYEPEMSYEQEQTAAAAREADAKIAAGRKDFEARRALIEEGDRKINERKKKRGSKGSEQSWVAKNLKTGVLAVAGLTGAGGVGFYMSQPAAEKPVPVDTSPSEADNGPARFEPYDITSEQKKYFLKNVHSSLITNATDKNLKVDLKYVGRNDDTPEKIETVEILAGQNFSAKIDSQRYRGVLVSPQK
jgi:hypothetical protein